MAEWFRGWVGFKALAVEVGLAPNGAGLSNPLVFAPFPPVLSRLWMAEWESPVPSLVLCGESKLGIFLHHDHE
jgi:hypothetical protein